MSKIEVNTIEPQCGTTVTVGKCTSTVAVPGNVVKSNAVQASDGGNIVSQSGTDITLGASGDTVALASGASQTGFGRTGTVDWDTSIHTGTVTAATGKGYFVNTTAGGITVNLPAAAVGSIVAVSDYASTAASNNITVAPNGSENINAVNDDYIISTAGLSVTLVYADATRGWKSVTGSDADATGVVPLFVTATGGTPCSGAISGDFKTHVFTGPGTLCVSCAGNACGSTTVDYLVSAGGGGGGGYGAGAGGAGGFRLSNSVGCIAAPVMSPLASPTGITASVSGYPIVIGGGGAGGSGPACGVNGSDSSFSTITSSGGGFGTGSAQPSGGPGGSGGGARGGPTPTSGYPGGAGNTPPFSPPQGTTGGAGYDGLSCSTNGGGGGGAGAVGGNAAAYTGGDGGAGSFMSDTFFGPISPSYGEVGPVTDTRYISGGGGGGTDSSHPSATPGPGGVGGGGNGAQYDNVATAGSTNMGAGGGGGGSCTAPVAGGSGIVIIRYKFQ